MVVRHPIWVIVVWVVAAAAIIVTERRDGGPLTADDSAKVAAIAQDLAAQKVADVTAIVPTPPSANKLIQLIVVQMTPLKNPNDRSQATAVRNLREELQPRLVGTDLKA